MHPCEPPGLYSIMAGCDIIQIPGSTLTSTDKARDEMPAAQHLAPRRDTTRNLFGLPKHKTTRNLLRLTRYHPKCQLHKMAVHDAEPHETRL